MTLSDDLPQPVPTSAETDAAPSTTLPPAESICPYLRSSGGWRSVAPAREHRCSAVTPAARLAPEKQARLCLTPSHPGCATFGAALEARATTLPARDGSARPLARTVVTITESARPPLLRRLASGIHHGGQVVVGALMIVALVAVVVARLEPAAAVPSPTPAPSEAVGSPSDTPSLTSEPPPSAEPTPTPTPRPTPVRTPSPAPSGTPTSIPTSYLRYTVQVGDTLFSIATRFGTTVTAIAEANNITNVAYVRAGDVLLIPR